MGEGGVVGHSKKCLSPTFGFVSKLLLNQQGCVCSVIVFVFRVKQKISDKQKKTLQNQRLKMAGLLDFSESKGPNNRDVFM